MGTGKIKTVTGAILVKRVLAYTIFIIKIHQAKDKEIFSKSKRKCRLLLFWGYLKY